MIIFFGYAVTNMFGLELNLWVWFDLNVTIRDWFDCDYLGWFGGEYLVLVLVYLVPPPPLAPLMNGVSYIISDSGYLH